jgi:hypothetical protein
MLFSAIPEILPKIACCLRQNLNDHPISVAEPAKRVEATLKRQKASMTFE